MSKHQIRIAVVSLVVIVAQLVGCEQGSIDSSVQGSASGTGDRRGNAADGSGDSGAGSGNQSPSPNTTVFQQQVLTITNQNRAMSGLAPLALNARLTEAAQAYAELMAEQNWFSHNSPDGTTPGARIAASGYRARTWGENIAWGYTNPDAVMTGWMNSSGHRDNIMSANFTEIGIGYATSGNAAYWVQDFGAQ